MLYATVEVCVFFTLTFNSFFPLFSLVGCFFGIKRHLTLWPSLEMTVSACLSVCVYMCVCVSESDYVHFYL